MPQLIGLVLEPTSIRSELIPEIYKPTRILMEVTFNSSPSLSSRNGRGDSLISFLSPSSGRRESGVLEFGKASLNNFALAQSANTNICPKIGTPLSAKTKMYQDFHLLANPKRLSYPRIAQKTPFSQTILEEPFSQVIMEASSSDVFFRLVK
jgi:hypothetical protein